jgi:hypothetical protein
MTGHLETEAAAASDPFAPLGPQMAFRATPSSAPAEIAERAAEPTEETTRRMHDTAPGTMHYIDTDLDLREWVATGFARLEDYLACWRLFRELYPLDPQ